jgi:ferrochelatase
MPVALGMSYGKPSLESAVDSLLAQGVDHIVVLALYPQYSCSTVAAVWDELARILATRRRIPGVTFIRDYADNELYIKALANSARASFEKHGEPDLLLLSITASRSVSPMKGMIIRSAAAIPPASWFPPSACRRRR